MSALKLTASKSFYKFPTLLLGQNWFDGIGPREKEIFLDKVNQPTQRLEK